MSTSKQDQAFAETMKSEIEVTIDVNSSALDIAVDFIASNFDPQDVFSTKDLENWAESNGYTKE